METNELYKTAVKNNYLFKTNKGFIQVQDLFHLPLVGEVSLDEVAKTLAKNLKEEEELSFVHITDKNKEVELKLEIVKDIISDKLKKQEERKQAAEKAAKKEKILKILASKQDKALEEKTEEQLLEELEALEK